MKQSDLNLTELSRKRESYLEEIASTYDETLRKTIRKHFVKLFSEAYKVDPGLVAVLVGMGGACVSGVVKYKDDENESIEFISLNRLSYKDDGIFHPETKKLLAEVTTYSELLCGNDMADLPYFDDITATEINIMTQA